MGFGVGSYASVWEVKSISPTMTKVRISTSRKNKMTDQYEQDFGDYVVFVGSACASKALKLKPRDRIRLGNVTVENRFDKEKHVTYYDFKAFDFEMVESNGGGNGATYAPAPTARAATPMIDNEPVLDDDDVPF